MRPGHQLRMPRETYHGLVNELRRKAVAVEEIAPRDIRNDGCVHEKDSNGGVICHISDVRAEFPGFTLRVTTSSNGKDPFRIVEAEVLAAPGGRLSLLVSAFPDRLHGVGASESECIATSYYAFINPTANADVLIQRAERVMEAVEKVGRDATLDVALDAKEVLHQVEKSVEAVRERNSWRGELDAVLEACSASYKGALEKIANDPVIRKAMGAVCEKS